MKSEKTVRFVIGLGNPEEKYRNSPHNLGCQLVEFIRKQKELKWKREKCFDCTESDPSYVRLHSYMNCSGEAILSLFQKFKGAAAETLICCDDFDLPLGTIRIRKRGSAGNHNGLKSVVEYLKTQDFARLRLGIGPLPAGEDPADFVLRPMSKVQETIAEQMIEKASLAIQVIVSDGLEIAMNRFNQRQGTTPAGRHLPVA